MNPDFNVYGTMLIVLAKFKSASKGLITYNNDDGVGGVDRSFAVLPVYFLPLKSDEDGNAKRVKRRAELAASWQLRHASEPTRAGNLATC